MLNNFFSPYQHHNALPSLNGRVSASGGTAIYTCSTLLYTYLPDRGVELLQMAMQYILYNALNYLIHLQLVELCRYLYEPLGAVYRCNTGNSIIGSSFRICQPDGTWNGNAPTCQGDSDVVTMLLQAVVHAQADRRACIAK